MYPNQPPQASVPPGVDPAQLAWLQQQWAAQFGGYPPGHPFAGVPDQQVPAATPSAQAAMVPPPPVDQSLVSNPDQVFTGQQKRPLLGILGAAFVVSAAAGTAVAVGKLLDRLLGLGTAGADDVDQAAPHDHG